MRLKSLTLEHYRNYQKLEYSFDPKKDVFLIIGQNAQGKTNILEAIYLLALCKSFRPTDFEGLTKWDEEYFRIHGEVEKENDPLTLEIIHQLYPKKKKAHKVNGVKKTVTDFVGHFYVTFFSPDDVNMIFQAPSLRRKYLDIVLSQMSKPYLQNLLKIKKVLQNRNKILKGVRMKTSNVDELDFWNEKFSEISLSLLKEREEMIEFYNEHIVTYYKKIANEDFEMSVNYKSNIRGMDQEEIRKNLDARLERDLREESTTLGPHRDDLEFFLDKNLMQHFCSRGEIRSALLALKMTEIDYFMHKTGVKPLLLLDDAFSELDQNRKQFLLDLVGKHQTIITSTKENEKIFKDLKSTVYLECNGGILKEK